MSRMHLAFAAARECRETWNFGFGRRLDQWVTIGTTEEQLCMFTHRAKPFVCTVTEAHHTEQRAMSRERYGKRSS
jgi:predicted GIY-YIG superfamily endonuclease